MTALPRRYWIIATAIIAGLIALWLIPRGDRAPETAPPPAKPAAPQGGDAAIALTPAQAEKLGLRWASAAAATEAPIAELPATIAPPANARVAVTALYPGVVRRTYVVEGDPVRAGQPLALVASTDVLSVGADLARAQARLGVAQSSARRLGQLDREGIIAGARADEARAMLREAQADVSEKRRLLGMANASGHSGTYTLTAPIGGRVSAMTVKTGSAVDPSQAPFVVDATDAYEVQAQLPERLIAAARPGMTVRLADGTSGTVVAVGNTLDPATRSAPLKARIPPAPGVISGGATSIALYGPAPQGAVLVPSSALADLNGRAVVFVRARNGVVPRTVRTGATIGQDVLITDGLKPGESVVMAGTSELKSLALAR